MQINRITWAAFAAFLVAGSAIAIGTRGKQLSSPNPPLGQKVMAASASVTIASDQTAGTFWQATQPVSLASAPTTAVTGTFWQTTQPISGSVSITPLTGTLTDGSGTITSGGTSQQIFASNGTRKYLLIVNNSTAVEWINFTTAAVAAQPSIQIAPNGGSYFMSAGAVSTEAVNIIGATTAQSFTAKQM